MVKTTFIYELIDPRNNETRYIGKSNNPQERLLTHIAPINLKKHTHKISWIKKLKKENLQPILNIIDEVNRSEWEYWEKFYIGAYKAIGCKLTNGTEGGDGNSNQRTKESNKKRSLTLKGRILGVRTEETYKKISLAKKKEKKWQGINNPSYKKNMKKGDNPHAKKISMYDIQGNYIRNFSCIKEAKEFINKGDINIALKNFNKTAGGFKWKYIN